MDERWRFKFERSQKPRDQLDVADDFCDVGTVREIRDVPELEISEDCKSPNSSHSFLQKVSMIFGTHRSFGMMPYI